ncbi:LacI family DNA-binding transcriptional regulator [Devosia psychrophila]|uniref:LacI family transcriptional regulator n=1 Tax=Devosia psychrophila TaxID=728005 RepID=A0A0F5PST5_9HYPH|nr:LacI family DNA-binding transcriptional regulator [Devosia psychrophila]KKC31752.1 LacI family transcriptional regulator [Devosia psychrophila]SFD42641.1 transcriptional regulator, LacI family [Devosia psychrophila]
MQGRRATQKDVARLAGVSQASVSMVLSGSPSPALSAETLYRINEAAAELGYTPNRFAQALKTNRTMTIACMVPDITNPFYPALMRGIQSVTDTLGYDVIAVNTDGTMERERHFLDWSRQGRVDGLIGVFFNLRAQDFKPLIDAGMPVVRIESAKKRGGDLAIDDIYVDSQAASFAVTQYLIAKGHRRIAMVAGRGGPQAVRIEGYKAALAAASLIPDVMLETAFSEENGFAAAEKILQREERPTAIFAANDLMAIGVMQLLRERNVAIPADIAVVGFDDISAAKLVTPSLTTVAQFQYQMGVKAAEILMQRLRGVSTTIGTAIEMPFSLVERGST